MGLSAKKIAEQERVERNRLARRKNMKSTYGITPLEYDQMLEQRGPRCPICGLPNENPHIDHCHKTEKVRGLLCRACNTALGMLKDNPKACLRAAIYLQSALEPAFPCTLNTLDALVADAFSSLGPRKQRKLRARFL
jgi:Recombination endonuclease VII